MSDPLPAPPAPDKLTFEEIEVPWNDKSQDNNFAILLPGDARILATYRREDKFYFLFSTRASRRLPYQSRLFVAMRCSDDSPSVWTVDNPDKYSIDYLGGDYVWYALTNDAKTVHFFEVKEKKP